MERNIYKIRKELFITSNEEIKEGDIFLGLQNQISCATNKDIYGGFEKKIILTTDPDLIKDGVQAIDDEFLEWFVKNPSCEEVIINFERYEKGVGLLTSDWRTSNADYYKIIIPKEEPKQEIYWVGVVKWNDGTILRTEPFYNYDNGIKEWSSKFSYENQGKFEWIDYEKFEKLKQETLEKADLKEMLKEATKQTTCASERMGFIAGAKWQAERMYSEEEVLELLIKFDYYPTMYKGNSIEEINKWFEQFKKK